MLITREITNAELADLLEQLPRVGLPQAGIVAEAVKRLRAAALASQGAEPVAERWIDIEARRILGPIAPAILSAIQEEEKSNEWPDWAKFTSATPEASETAAGAVSERLQRVKHYATTWERSGISHAKAIAQACDEAAFALATPPAATQVPSDDALKEIIRKVSDEMPSWGPDSGIQGLCMAVARAVAARTQSAPPAAQQIGGVE